VRGISDDDNASAAIAAIAGDSITIATATTAAARVG